MWGWVPFSSKQSAPAPWFLPLGQFAHGTPDGLEVGYAHFRNFSVYFTFRFRTSLYPFHRIPFKANSPEKPSEAPGK